MTPSADAPQTHAPRRRGPAFWVGWALSVLLSLFMAMGGVMNVISHPMATQGLVDYGYPAGVNVPIGLVLLASVALFLVPRTAAVGAILLTAYLGGAVDVHVRAGEPWFLAVIFGVAFWIALVLRSPELRVVLPWRGRGG